MSRKKVFLVTSAILIVVIGVFFFIFLSKDGGRVERPVDEIGKDIGQNNSNMIADENVTRRIEKIEGEDLDRQQILTLVDVFIRRVSSYSNHGGYQNILTTQSIVSEEMAIKISAWVDELEKKNNSYQDYRGVTSRVISKNIETFDAEAGLAEVRVALQREFSDGKENNIYYDEFLIKVSKVNRGWIINSIDPFDEL